MADVTTTFAAKDESFAKTVEKLQGRLKGFEGDLKGFSGRVGQLASSFGKLLGPLAAAGAAFLGIKSAADAFFGAIAKGGELNDLSARTGESVGNLAILQRAFENAGAGADSVGPMINKLQMAIVEAAGDPTSKAAIAFNKLGIGLEELRTKSPLEMFKMLGPAIAEIEDPIKRTEIARALLAKGGAEMIPLLRAMGIELENSQRQLGSYPEALNKSNQALDTIGDNFTAIKNKGIEFATGLLVNVAPGLAAVTTKIAEIDAARLGMILSDHLAGFLRAADGAFNFTKNLDAAKVAIQGMADGQIGEGLSLMFVTAKIQALSLVNEFVAAMGSGFKAIGVFLVEAFAGQGVRQLIESTIDFIGLKFESVMMTSIGKIMHALPFVSHRAADALEDVGKAADIQATAMTYYMSNAAAKITKELIIAGAAMPNTFATEMHKMDRMFDLTDEIAEQQRLQENIKANLATSAENAGQTADNVSRANESATGFGEKVGQAKGDLKFAADLYTGPNGVAVAAADAAEKTRSASESTAQAFQIVSDSGSKVEASLTKAADYLGRSAIEAGRTFKQEVIAAMSHVTSAQKQGATESTLRAVLGEMQNLSRRLPQPVLV